MGGTSRAVAFPASARHGRAAAPATPATLPGVRAVPALLDAGDVVRLQRSIGNRATTALVTAGSATSPASPAVTFPPVWLQRLTPDEKLIDLKSPDLAGDPELEKAFDNSPSMKVGASGDHVKKVQRGLMDDGFIMPKSTDGGGCDGKFGSETKRAVESFQRKHGIGVDGSVGRKTLGKLDELNLALGGRGRGGGKEVTGADTGFEIRGKDPRAGRPANASKAFFAEHDATLDTDEKTKLDAFAVPADRPLTLRGARSEDEDPALATTRIAAVSAYLGTKKHTAARTPDPRPGAGAGRLRYRAVRMVEVVPSGATPSTPDCSAGPVVAAPPPNNFTTANVRALEMLDAALVKLNAPDATTRALVAALFRSPAHLPTIRSRLKTLRVHLNGWTDPAQHRIHNECDGSCVGTIAYIDGRGTRPLTLCPIFMNEPDLDERAGTLIHEGTHREPSMNTDDHAYLFERVINHLSSAQALKNADSYLALVRNLEIPGSQTIGPTKPDTPGAGMTKPTEVTAVNQAVAFAEKWLSATDSELGSLYSTIVDSRPSGRWDNGYYENTMKLIAPLFNFTPPPALPTPVEQQHIAGIADRIGHVHAFFSGAISFDRASTPGATTSIGKGRTLSVGDPFFRLNPTQRAHELIVTILQKVATISVDHQPKYAVMIDKIRKHFNAPAP